MLRPLSSRPLIVFLLLALPLSHVFATHFRAGEITARRLSLSSPTYEIKLTGYFDMIGGIGAAQAQNDVVFTINSTDGTGDPEFVTAPRIPPIVDIGNNTTQNVYIAIYTFRTAGAYRISVEEDARNDNVLNIGPKPTNRLNFYVSTTLEINAAFGLNRTPVLRNAPIDIAAVGQRYIHNPAAFDADGDSIAYRMFVPQQAGTNGRGINLEYQDPNTVTPPGQTETGASPATFSINRVTGDIIWDAPVTKGYYNVAFIVEEWRDGALIGQIVRDMQIIVEDARNDRPVLTPLQDICVEAGTLINQKVVATDKNGDKLTLTSASGLYDATLITPPLATFNVANQGAQGSVTGTFTWQTSCDHIRLGSYNVLFKVEDGPPPTYPNPSLFMKLADMTSFNIRVYGPKPTGLTGTAVTDPGGTAYRLNWDAYKCQIPNAKIVIYRAEKCTEIEEDVCEPGIPAGSGYEEIGRVDVNQTTYLDNNGGEGLRPGVSYSYRIAVIFPRPGASPGDPGYLIGGGKSLASAEYCLNLPMAMPVITNVTVDSTSTIRGQITVKWIRPAVTTGVPAQYKLFRATGQNGSAFTEIASINTNLTPGAADTLFVDKGLNTEANAYNYKLEYYTTVNGQLTKFDETETASSVRLEQGAAPSNQVGLKWTALVPWDNGNRVHRVYREDKTKPGTFNRIAEVSVTGPQTFTYVDDGKDKYAADGTVDVSIVKDSTYCYKVETVGSYNNSQIRPSVLYNFSQILCVSSSDTTKPCPPVLSLDPLNCDSLRAHPEAFCTTSGFTNHLTWEYPAELDGRECDPLVTAYRVYYARYEGDAPTLIATVTTPPSPLQTSFDHEGLTSFAGCYFVTAVNRFGSESAPSNTVCRDNCPMFVLPNVFTPNGDNKNDTFQPLECPAFVQSLEFKVYNRWGAQVYSTKDVNINWDGKTNGGKALAAGQYYYEVTIYFESFTKQGTETSMKGWVQLLR
ncbi:gliding motility-associated C-terminal domain-containing protein [Dyadobacter soli]|uniref:Gliding motility-associated C-terminal domain-containing protein n=1 Tax=Dyadobacter soli TaxID=659014 RepID=A0A1G7QIK5_9BACT|nr:gliding motility-associated C-terminal domain-containing protein [Dyadobacter soli]SDF98397.1 gliding motility-associated C-terminal domain-containing protein [Dyadobacter soli]